jgi:long-chain acyl-CoA synthetase
MKSPFEVNRPVPYETRNANGDAMLIQPVKRTDGQDRDSLPTMVHYLAAAAETAPDRPAVIVGDETITYGDYAAGAGGVAARLAGLGLERGNRVVIGAAPSVIVPQLILGAQAGGFAPAMVNPAYTPRELTPLLAIARPKAVLCDGVSRAALAEVASASGVPVLDISGGPEEWRDSTVRTLPGALPAAGDLGVILYTGGTTGISKGVPHTHAEIIAAMTASEGGFPSDLDTDLFLDLPPIFHIIGLYHGVFQPIYGRNTTVFLPRFHPDLFYDALETHRPAAGIVGAPTAYSALIHHPRFESADFSSLKFCMSGGAPLPDAIIRAWEKRAGSPILEGYGMSEGAPTTTNPLHGTRKLRSAGLPTPGTEFEIVDLATGIEVLAPGEEGEIRVRGPQVCRHYFNNPEATAEAFRDGWLYTGDIAFMDEEGYVFIVDRKKDMALVSGFNVYPREIDEVLLSHPKVKEAASIGVPDEYRGEVIKAVIVAKEGETLSEQELTEFCARNLVKYKVPAIFQFVDEVPKTPVGKVDKKRLRAAL